MLVMSSKIPLKIIFMRYKEQCILLDWFRSQSDGTISKSRVRRITQSIEATIYDGIKDYRLENYLNPLLSIGLLEYQLDDKYCLGPTVAIQTKQNSILINYPKTLLNKTNNILAEKYSGHIIIIDSKVNSSSLNCPVIGHNKSILRFLPSLKDIVSGWKEYNNIDNTLNLERLTNSGWIMNKLNETGVYRFIDKPGSQLLIKLKNNTYSIPFANSLDGLAIAYQVTNQNNLSLVYDDEMSTLEINTFLFPIVVQRLLIHLSKFHFEFKDRKLKLSNISKKDFVLIKSKLYA